VIVLVNLLMYSAPIALAAMGEVVAQRSGVINISLEGGMLVAALTGMMVCLATGSPWIGMGAALVAALVFTLVFGVFTVFLASDQVVVGTAMNLLALGLTGTIFRSKIASAGKLESVARVGAFHGVDPIMVFMVLSVPLLWFLLSRTGWGLAVRSCGEYPKATEASGFSVRRLRMQALSLGGLYAGLAGAYLVLVINGTFSENMTAGRGFVAIAMVTFGRWKPQWAFLSALLIGYLTGLQFNFQASGSKVPFQLMIALPYVVALVVLIIVGRGSAAPGALAQPYRKES